MEAVKANRTPVPQNSTNKYISIGIILTILLVVAIYINNVSKAFQAASLPKGTAVISQGTLEEKYGLQRKSRRFNCRRWYGGCSPENCGW